MVAVAAYDRMRRHLMYTTTAVVLTIGIARWVEGHTVRLARQ
jgi:hypothetical protein